MLSGIQGHITQQVKDSILGPLESQTQTFRSFLLSASKNGRKEILSMGRKVWKIASC